MSKKKVSITWRIIRFLIVTIIWGLIKLIFKLIGKIIKLIFRGIKTKREESKIKKSEFYKMSSKFEELKLHTQIEGEYDHFIRNIYNKSLIVLIFGKRGSGKSALGFRILENIHFQTERKCYVLGVRKEVLPSWINAIDDVDKASTGSVILVDEGAISYSSRESMSQHNKELAKLMAIARHKDLTLIFITQNTGMIDKNVLKLTDTLIVKEGSLLQLEMERNEIKKFYLKAKSLFENTEEKVKYAYLIDSDFEGFVEYKLPSFWREEISKSRAKS